MKKQRTAELNKKIKQLRSSRDNLKELNREKRLYNKRLRDRGVEITASRDHWKQQCKEQCEGHLLAHEELKGKLNAFQAELELERTRANVERERAEKLEAELEEIRKKK